jgi:hypothetical protein
MPTTAPRPSATRTWVARASSPTPATPTRPRPTRSPRFGTPFASGASAAVEWWATTLEEGRPATLIGTSVLTFTPDGLVAVGRDYWFLEPGFHLPFEGWGC